MDVTTEIYRLSDSGESTRMIATILGLSQSKVSRTLRKRESANQPESVSQPDSDSEVTHTDSPAAESPSQTEVNEWELTAEQEYHYALITEAISLDELEHFWISAVTDIERASDFFQDAKRQRYSELTRARTRLSRRPYRPSWTD